MDPAPLPCPWKAVPHLQPKKRKICQEASGPPAAASWLPALWGLLGGQRGTAVLVTALGPLAPAAPEAQRGPRTEAPRWEEASAGRALGRPPCSSHTPAPSSLSLAFLLFQSAFRKDPSPELTLHPTALDGEVAL